MKVLKGLALALVSVLFVFSAVLLQANIALNGTVFSDSFFNDRFDRSIQPEDVEQLVNSMTGSAEAFMPLDNAERKALEKGTASKELKQRVAGFKAVLRDAIDTQWLGEEAPRLVKGLFSFLTGNGESLPTVGIRPLKEALLQTFANQFASQGGLSQEQFNEMVKQMELAPGGILNAGGEPNELLVGQIVQLGQAASIGIRQETARKILVKIGNRAKDGTSDKELYDFTVRALAGDALGAADMKDTLDLNVLVQETYRGDSNPVTGFPVMFRGLRGSLMLMNVLLFALLLCVIAVVAFKPADILRWVGTPLILAGAMGIIPAALIALSNVPIGQFFSDLAAQNTQYELGFLKDWALSYAGGVALFLLAQGTVFILVGAGCLVGARYAYGSRGDARPSSRGVRRQESRTGNSGAMVCRVAAVVVLLAAIPLSVWIIGRNILRQVDDYDRIVQKAKQQQKGTEFSAALMKALGVKIK